jgi:hypothetical protein
MVEATLPCSTFLMLRSVAGVNSWPFAAAVFNNKLITLWPESASGLNRSSNRHLSAKLAPTFAGRGVSRSPRRVPYCRNLGFLDWNKLAYRKQINLVSDMSVNVKELLDIVSWKVQAPLWDIHTFSAQFCCCCMPSWFIWKLLLVCGFSIFRTVHPIIC